MTKIHINGREWTTPSSWNELTDKQLLKYCPIVIKDELALFMPSEVVPLKLLQLIKTLFYLDNQLIQKWPNDCEQAYSKEEGIAHLSKRL